MKHNYIQFLLPAMLLASTALTAGASIASLPSNPTPEVITNPIPDATREVYIKSGLGFFQANNRLSALPSDGSLTYIAVQGDEMYIGKAFSWFTAPGWLKGKITKDAATAESKVTFTFPQAIESYWEDYNGVMTEMSYYAVVCDMVTKGQTADMIPTDEQTYSFKILEDGSLQPEDPDLFIGEFSFIDREWSWTDRGEFYNALTLQTEKPVRVPEGVEFMPMVLTYPHLALEGTLANPVELGFDGNDVYLRGMAIGISDLPDAVIKGSRDGSTVTFPSYQFLGDSELFGFTQYFIAGDWDEQSVTGFLPESELIFNYDEAGKTLISDMSFIIVPAVQEDAGDLYYENVYTNPEIFYSDPAAGVTELETPVLVNYYPADNNYPLEVDFMVSMLSKEHTMLDLSNLYFEIWDASGIFTFNPSVYKIFDKPTTQVPFGISDFSASSTFVCRDNIVQLMILPDYKANLLRLRLVYKQEGKEDVFSDFLTVFDQTSIDLTEASPIATTFTDLNGLHVVNPTKGIYLRSTILSDGSVRHEKIVVR